MKNREKQLLFQLLRDSKLSDREIAKKLKTSQSTITRNRHKLERKYIKSYTIIPNLSKLDIKLIAFNFANLTEPNPNLMKKIGNFIGEQPNVVFVGHGEGMGKTGVIISFHKDYSDFIEFMRKARLVCPSFAETLESFIVSTDKVPRILSMAKAVEFLVKKEEKKIGDII